jgi:hypothetical protein
MLRKTWIFSGRMFILPSPSKNWQKLTRKITGSLYEFAESRYGFHHYSSIIFISPGQSKTICAQPVTPTEHIFAVINEALPYLQAEGMDRNSRWQRVRKVLHQHFDFRSLTQNVLDKHWNTGRTTSDHCLFLAIP